MGGSAFLIYGTVSDALLQPRPAPRSLVSRLLGKSTAAAPEWTQIGPNRRLMNLPTAGFEKLGDEFRAYLERHFERPWAATASIIAYLDTGVVDLHLRGDQERDAAASWYVQLNFSGCAGMAEISSQVATHWAEQWYRDDSARLASALLRPHGFEPNGRTSGADEDVVFVPIGRAGYAAYVANPSEDSGDDESGLRPFELDASVTETLDEHEEDELMRRLESELLPLIPKGKCCCQWCSPEFDVDAIDRLALFK